MRSTGKGKSKDKKVKVKVRDIALLHDAQERFTISEEVAADWHELMIPQRIMRPSIARAIANSWTRGAAHRHTTSSISHTRSSPRIARKLLLIFRPANGRRLSWPERTVGYQLAQGCLQMTRVRFEPQRESYESDTLTTRPLTPMRGSLARLKSMARAILSSF